jgi:hypothetical protein
MTLSNSIVKVLRNKYVQTTVTTLLTALFGYGYYEFFSSDTTSITSIGYNLIITFLVYATIFSAIGATYSWLRLVKRLRKLIYIF